MDSTHLIEASDHRRGAGGLMADASLNRRMTVRLGDAVAFAQVGIVGPGVIKVEALVGCVPGL